MSENRTPTSVTNKTRVHPVLILRFVSPFSCRLHPSGTYQSRGTSTTRGDGWGTRTLTTGHVED